MNEVVTRPANIFIFFKVSYICLFPLLKKKKTTVHKPWKSNQEPLGWSVKSVLAVGSIEEACPP